LFGCLTTNPMARGGRKVDVPGPGRES
jgi:hypothetical protein